MSWFTAADETSTELELGTIKVKVIEGEDINIEDIAITNYEKDIKIENLGNKAYVRVRLVPEWTNHNLPISNIELNLSDNNDWIYSDGHYYFKYYLKEGEITSSLLDSVSFTKIDKNYEGASFKLNVIVEGVQMNEKAWKDTWRLDDLPFEPGKPLTQ